MDRTGLAMMVRPVRTLGEVVVGAGGGEAFRAVLALCGSDELFSFKILKRLPPGKPFGAVRLRWWESPEGSMRAEASASSGKGSWFEALPLSRDEFDCVKAFLLDGRASFEAPGASFARNGTPFPLADSDRPLLRSATNP